MGFLQDLAVNREMGRQKNLLLKTYYEEKLQLSWLKESDKSADEISRQQQVVDSLLAELRNRFNTEP